MNVLRSKSLLGRVNRLLRAAHPRFAAPDDAWARAQLPDAEFSVYAAMDPRDREHAVRVARRVLEMHPDASSILLRGALLHDSGKQVRPYVWLERIAAGLVERPFQTPLLEADWRSRTYTALEVRLRHPQFGAALIRAAGGDARVAEIVERHHAPGADEEARVIHAVDELE